MQAHHKKILQKITLQNSLTDIVTDRCSFDGPSHESVVPRTSFCYFQTRAHAMEPTTHHDNLDGPSSGNRRVINEAYPTRPGWVFKNNSTFKTLIPLFHPILSLFLPFPSLFNFQRSYTPLSYNRSFPPNSPKS